MAPHPHPATSRTARRLGVHPADPTPGPAALPARTGCLEQPEVFQHPLLEEPPTGSAGVADRAQARRLTARAAGVCAGCPLRAPCLYRAVVEVDISGFVAGTTARQRAAIRGRLGMGVAREDFDTLAGITGAHRQVDHAEVLRVRAANPSDSLETLAHRLGCSLSTVKRHLRRERREPSAPTIPVARPTADQVADTARQVLGGGRRQAA
ncbi:MAG: transcription factor WhiB [Friedmanniella sp.]|nr:transcription factor WhiB [Friedmanniella sp.]